MDLFCRIIFLENAAKFSFFCRNLSEALHMKTEGCLLPCLWVKIKDFGLSYGVHDETPIFLAVKVPLRLHSQLKY